MQLEECGCKKTMSKIEKMVVKNIIVEMDIECKFDLDSYLRNYIFCSSLQKITTAAKSEFQTSQRSRKNQILLFYMFISR